MFLPFPEKFPDFLSNFGVQNHYTIDKQFLEGNPMTETDILLADLARLFNTHGTDSPEVTAFLKTHADKKEFIELAEVSLKMKRIFNSFKSA